MTARELLAAQVSHNLTRLNYTVPEFAKLIEMPKQSIYRIVREEVSATGDIMDRLADGFDIPVYVLLAPVK